jgi:protein gp37
VGCEHCYAERQAGRFCGFGGSYHGLVRRTEHGARWTGTVRLVEAKLSEPRRWQRPRRIFVNSMSDLFHESVADYVIERVLSELLGAPQHTFLVLTKRPARMRDVLRRLTIDENAVNVWLDPAPTATPWVFPNLWLGVSVENQAAADERIPILLDTPAALRWVSAEPLLGPIDLGRACWGELNHHSAAIRALDWVVVGGESGPGARPCEAGWLLDAVRACASAGVPCFVKQLGAAYSDPRNGVAGRGLHPSSDGGPVVRRLASRAGSDPEEWPEALRVREWPEVRRG